MTNTVTLELNSDPELIRYTHLQNAAAWKSKLTAEQYADREWTVGCDSKIGQRQEDRLLGVYHFVLRDSNIHSDDKFGDVVAACETMNRMAWRADADGSLLECVAPCIGAVFTNENHRGKGYAAQMITLLNEYWDKRLDKKSFMFLYSEVGDYYQRFGYESYEVKLHSVHGLEKHEPTEQISSDDYHYLEYEEYHKLVELQYDKIKTQLVSSAQREKKVMYSLIPTMDTYSWFHDRDIFIASKLRPQDSVTHFGVTLNDDSNDRVVWLHDWNDDCLTLVTVEASTHGSFKKLFQLAVEEARLFGLHGIHLWDSALGADQAQHDENLRYLQTFAGSEFFLENGSRSAMRPLDGGARGSYEWAFNDKWCWF